MCDCVRVFLFYLPVTLYLSFSLLTFFHGNDNNLNGVLGNISMCLDGLLDNIIFQLESSTHCGFNLISYTSPSRDHIHFNIVADIYA